MVALPFSDENHEKLFRRALLEVIEGSRLLASTASTRRMPGFCGAVDFVLRVHVYPTYIFRDSH